jgi:hypothetical protein
MSRYRADDYCELDDPRPVRSTIITATDEIEAAKRTSLNMRDDEQQVE